MTKKQFNHYTKGGLFKAVYVPKEMDIHHSNMPKIGKQIIIHQNMIITPIQTKRWAGQFRFNSPDIYGWFPEEDVEIESIIDTYVETPEPVPVYMYRMTYTTYSQLNGNFGRGYENIHLPFVVNREYSSECDKYVLSLSNPQATTIEKAIWTGKYNEQIEWINITPDKN